MKKIVVLFSWMLFVGCVGTKAHQQPGKPVVYTLNIVALEKNKKAIKAKVPDLLLAYQSLLNDASKALKFGPVSVMEKKNIPPSGDMHDYMSLAPYHWPDPTKADGLPYIRKDGQTNPEVKEYKDKEYMPALCSNVFSLALAYYFSDDNVYAEHAVKLLEVWFLDSTTRMNPNLNFAQAIKGVNTGRGAGLIDSRHFVKVIDAIGLLQGSKFWTATNQQGMQQWFSSFLNWMQTSKNGISEMNAENNHGAWYDAQRLAMALFIGNNQTAVSIVQNAATRLDKQLDNNGMFPKEMERTISFHYTAFVMNAFFVIAQMSDKAGIDFWNLTTASGKSLKRAFEVLYPYLIKQKQWEGQQIKEFEYEDGYPLLMEAAVRYSCKKCKQQIQDLAGEKGQGLRINLLY